MQVRAPYRLRGRPAKLDNMPLSNRLVTPLQLPPVRLDLNDDPERVLHTSINATQPTRRCGRDSPERTKRSEETLTFKQVFFWAVFTRGFIKMGDLWVNYVFFLACCSGLCSGSPNRCDEVRKVFQLRQIGPNQLLPLSPRPGR